MYLLCKHLQISSQNKFAEKGIVEVVLGLLDLNPVTAWRKWVALMGIQTKPEVCCVEADLISLRPFCAGSRALKKPQDQPVDSGMVMLLHLLTDLGTCMLTAVQLEVGKKWSQVAARPSSEMCNWISQGCPTTWKSCAGLQDLGLREPVGKGGGVSGNLPAVDHLQSLGAREYCQLEATGTLESMLRKKTRGIHRQLLILEEKRPTYQNYLEMCCYS